MHNAIGHKICPYSPECLGRFEVLYADDTLIFGNRAREINILLHQLEHESALYNLHLNKSKCVYLGMNGKANVHFKDGTQIEKVGDTPDLGGIIEDKGGTAKEITGLV